MKKALLAAFAVVMACSIAACGNDDNANNRTADVQESDVAAVIKLIQTPPYFVLREGEGGTCKSRAREAADPIELTLKNAEGAIVGAETLPFQGGSFADGTCTWNIELTVPESDFYEARLEVSGREIDTQVGQRDGDNVVIQVDF